MSDEKHSQSPLDERPHFQHPFPADAGRQSLEQYPVYNLDDGAQNKPASLQVRYSAPSISSRPSTTGNPDLLLHGASAFASSRKQNMTRSASQAFRRPRPSTMLTTEIPKPWLKYKDPAHRWAKWLFWAGWLAGIAITAGRELLRLPAGLPS
jgi:hypothetical protein